MATPRIKVDPEVIRWAVWYSRREAYLREEYKDRDKIADWETGEQQPTYAQLREFAKATRVPEGYLICNRIPDYALGDLEMRTLSGSKPDYPSPDLVDTLVACRARQAWYVDYSVKHGLDPLPFVGALTVGETPEDAARVMAQTIGFTPSDRERTNREGYRLALTRRIEEAGVMVMINSVVDNNTSRGLDADEFRGFSLVHPLAPLIFANSADALGTQVFTLAHEFAHVLLGKSGVSAPDSARQPTDRAEVWCNAVAAEFLVPRDELAEVIDRQGGAPEVDQLSMHFKVSKLVVLRRLRDTGHLSGRSFANTYGNEIARSRAAWRAVKSRSKGDGSGGDFYRTLTSRVGRRFASALVTDTEGGGTLYTDAAELLGVRDGEHVDTLHEKLGLTP